MVGVSGVVVEYRNVGSVMTAESSRRKLRREVTPHHAERRLHNRKYDPKVRPTNI